MKCLCDSVAICFWGTTSTDWPDKNDWLTLCWWRILWTLCCDAGLGRCCWPCWWVLPLPGASPWALRTCTAVKEVIMECKVKSVAVFQLLCEWFLQLFACTYRLELRSLIVKLNKCAFCDYQSKSVHLGCIYTHICCVQIKRDSFQLK